MSKTPYLVPNRHGTAWYARVIVPKHLRAHFSGRTEIRRTTGVRDRRLAGVRANGFLAKCHYLFSCIEMAKQKPGFDFKSNYTSFIDVMGLKHEFDFGGGPDNPDAAVMELKAAEEQRAKVTNEYLELLGKEAVVERLMSSPNKVAAEAPKPAPVGRLMDEVIDGYLKEEERRATDPSEKLGASTMKEKRPKIMFWREYFKGRTADTITKEELKTLPSWLSNLPANYKRKKLNGKFLTTSEAIAVAATNGHNFGTLAASSYNHFARELTGILRYAFHIDALPNDLSSMVRQKNAKLGKNIDRHPYTNDELALMFDPKTYGQRTINGRVSKLTPSEARFWLPIISLYTGARLEELAQLSVRDLKNELGIWYINITDSDYAHDGQELRLKNKNSIRKVPVHQDLIDAGFVEYTLARSNMSGLTSSLFNIESRGANGKLGSAFSKWFSNKSDKGKGFLERSGIKSREKVGTKTISKTFHGFRHTFIDCFRGSKFSSGELIRDADIALVVGHSDDLDTTSLTTADYGVKTSDLSVLKEVVDALQYPNLKLPKWTDVIG